MAPLPKQNAAETPVVVGRRSTRLAVAVPVTISGTDADGKSFKERVFTLSLNVHGAEIATNRRLALNQEIVVENSSLGRKAKAQVVRQRDRRSPTSPYEFCVELLKPENIWGVRFPPGDWEQEPSGMAAPGNAQPAAEPEKAKRADAAPPAVSRPSPPPGAATEAPPAPAAAGNTPTESRPPQAPVKSQESVGVTEEAVTPKPAAAPEAPVRGEETMRALRAREEQLSSLADRLQASSGELKKLLAEFEQARANGQAELERIKSGIADAAAQAVESARQAWRERLASDTELAQSRLLEEALPRLRKETATLAEASKREVAASLASLSEESLAQATCELRARQAVTLDETKEQLRLAMQGATPEFHEKLRVLGKETAARLAEEMEGSLKKSAEEARARLAESFREQERAAARQSETLLAQGLEKFREQARGENAATESRMKQLVEGQAARAASSLDEAMAKLRADLQASFRKSEIALAEETEKHRRRIADHSQFTMQGFQNYTDKILAGNQAEFESVLRSHKYKITKEAAEELHQTSDALLESAARQLESQGQDALELWKEQTRVAAEAVAEDSRRQAAALTRSTLESLSKEVQATLEECRQQLQNKLQDFLARSGRDVEAALHEATARQREEFFERLEREVQESSARAVEAIRSLSEQAHAQVAGKIHQQVGEAVVVLKDWGDQARERFDDRFHSALEAFQKQVAEVARTNSEKFHERAAEVEKSLQARLLEAARALEIRPPEKNETSPPPHHPQEASGTPREADWPRPRKA